VLVFIGVHGIIDIYDAEETFDRVKFLESCRAFAYSKRGTSENTLGQTQFGF